MALSVPIWLYMWLVPVPPPARAAAPGHPAARGNATMSDLYDADFRRWTECQSGLLRRMGAGDRVNDQVDWNHVAEEIESLGKSDRRQVINRVATIVEHLMRLAASPADPPRPGWRRTVITQRARLNILLADSPSLRTEVPQAIAASIDRARILTAEALAEHSEQATIDLAAFTVTVDQVLGDWLP